MADPDKDKRDIELLRSIILAVIFVPIIVWLLYYAYTKNQDAPAKIAQCAKKCTSQGYSGYNFTWPFFVAPKCTCLGEPAQ